MVFNYDFKTEQDIKAWLKKAHSHAIQTGKEAEFLALLKGFVSPSPIASINPAVELASSGQVSAASAGYVEQQVRNPVKTKRRLSARDDLSSNQSRVRYVVECEVAACTCSSLRR